jgi:hypothetical protein
MYKKKDIQRSAVDSFVVEYFDEWISSTGFEKQKCCKQDRLNMPGIHYTFQAFCQRLSLYECNSFRSSSNRPPSCTGHLCALES